MTRTVQALFNLEGRTALVTGGSRGLGWQIAQALGEAGARVLISARKARELETDCAELKAQGIACDWVAADASKEDDIRSLAEQAMARMRVPFERAKVAQLRHALTSSTNVIFLRRQAFIDSGLDCGKAIRS